MPQYSSWEFLLRNELARDEGRRMYYVDETGETVPASDDEDDKVGVGRVGLGVGGDCRLQVAFISCIETYGL
jgi:hypothetical protein